MSTLIRYPNGLFKAHESTLSVVQRVADAIWIVAALAIADAMYPQAWSTQDTVSASIAVVVFHLAAEANGLYRPWRGAALRDELLRVFFAWLCVIPVLLFAAFATKTTAEFSRVISIGWFLLAPALVASWRALVRSALYQLRRHGANTRTVAVAGATKLGAELADYMRQDMSLGMRVVGFYDDRGPGRRQDPPPECGPVIGKLDQLLIDARAGIIDHVYIALPLKAEPRINDLVRRLADTTATVCVVADFFVFDLVHARWMNVGGIPVVSIFDTPFNGISAWLKRLEDVVVGALILVIIALPMLMISVAIKLTSPGPIFFRQKRYGLNGKEINVWKFRTMNVCEDGPSVVQAQRNDPRVTRLGAFLRRSSLDELPQFFNVICGEMSIVGPRPHAVAHNEMYRSRIRGYMLRHKVKPGITGWAQVNGWRGETDTDEKMERRIEHDLYYISNWSLWWDIRIIFLTVFGKKKSLNAY
jgi:putative colanic acid biosynthesis UDP-glucose lipid carrier transferase